MDSFSLRCFGVGDGWPCRDRNHSAFLYQFGKTHLLVDCGEPISREYNAAELSYDLVDRILLSHLHCDHVGGLFMLLQGFWLEQRQKDLRIHLPADGIHPIRQMLDAACIFDELYGFRLDFEALRTSETFQVGQVHITAHPSTHLESLRKSFQSKYHQAFQSFCFLFEYQGLRIGHSADIGSPDDLAPLFNAPLDLLVCELAHFKPEDLGRFLAGKQVKRIVFIHVGRRYWINLQETTRTLTQLLGPIPFSFAKDRDLITL